MSSERRTGSANPFCSNVGREVLLLTACFNEKKIVLHRSEPKAIPKSYYQTTLGLPLKIKINWAYWAQQGQISVSPMTAAFLDDDMNIISRSTGRGNYKTNRNFLKKHSRYYLLHNRLA